MSDLETRLRGALAEEVGSATPDDLLHDVRRAAARRRARRATGAVALVVTAAVVGAVASSTAAARPPHPSSPATCSGGCPAPLGGRSSTWPPRATTSSGSPSTMAAPTAARCRSAHPPVTGSASARWTGGPGVGSGPAAADGVERTRRLGVAGTALVDARRRSHVAPHHPGPGPAHDPRTPGSARDDHRVVGVDRPRRPPAAVAHLDRLRLLGASPDASSRAT